MTKDHIAEVKSLEALIGGSFPANLSKLSSSSRSIPTNRDFHSLYKSDEFKRPIDEIARTSQCVLETIGGKKSMTFPGDDDAYESLVKVNDEILEKFDDSIDEFKRNRTMEEDSKKAIDVKVAESDKRFEKHGKAKAPFHLPTITKPQEEYKILVDNANKPFDHVLLEKSEDGLRFIHPLEKLSVMDFVDKNLSEIIPVKPLPLEETPFKLVEEVKDLEDLAATLQSVEEFAVDLEHNQYRSFQGLTCLMQISTRTEDYIVDTFKLWDHIGPHLRELFKDPKKKKVMHGADHDIIWLQRDFGIYVCNLFDTGQASRVLKLERKSLEFLLKHYCGVAADKQYQNADWRIRPLPDVMTRYAREDTHYLLYIYDVMRIDLHTMAKEDEQSDSPLVEAYKGSYDVCMQLYEKELLTGDSYLHTYGVRSGNLNAVQLSIVAGLCEWRDRIARADDESTGYVLPNKTLFDIAKDMPITTAQLRRLLKSKHPYIERNFDAVISVIRRSMQNAAAFEPVVQSLKDWRPETVVEKNIEPKIEKTGTEASSSSLSLKKFSVDDSKKQNSSGFGNLPSKRKFESDKKVKEEVKASKSKPNEVIIVVDDDDDDDDESYEQSSETADALNRVSETPSNGSLSMTQKPKICNKEIIVLDDDDESENDSESREEEEMRRRSEKHRRFMNMKRGFLNI
ncbi:3'-5' exonuclease domain [Arabidopsis thaliana x Arabidopsis arenosa]|uniref:3'-5' exonuclease domain n=1 Tax=Arabidopsis thaliana x Arabidopsis arenosa TaxID=1240361 RepID=A0A8T2BKH8_9BRAS|nr:3'-5' exonuclease domain [Arabidopsis thaliana x Arabidopsis arenosa]